MTALHLIRRPLDGGTLIGVAGELDCTNAAELEAYIIGEHPDAALPLVLHLSAVTFMDSSGLHLLIDLHHRTEAGGGSLHLAAPHERVSRVLQITGTDRLLHTHPTLDQALAATGLTAPATADRVA
ncbi:STAS domain-containing protein [Nonomuraea typhae]|uniref:STAS domain-containing protein n=1 Tax=Nonomuraea typhae TaxID=2603600 RepID=UPI0012FAD788|nr:STAS domain-containing protein [Nonomuraea typhae]